MQHRSGALLVASATVLFAGLFAGSCAPTPDVNRRAGAHVTAVPSAQVTTRLVVEKREHRMRAYRGNTLLREFSIALGRGGLAPKVQQGDGRVPEGEYVIDTRNPNSAFHLSLRISYPTPRQIESATARGIDPGGDIMIHGLPTGRATVGKSHRLVDWTEGCIAVTNPEIEWLWQNIPDGTPILIKP
jgi:murein L,D-transpeptidase YafK